MHLGAVAVGYPRRLIKYNVVEQTLGSGSFRHLTQPDHWRLIDEGRFTRDQTFQPCPLDGFFTIWAANYSPRSEAVGLLEQLGIGPEPSDEDLCGLNFVNCAADDDGNPAVYCDTTRAISLLQAELLQRGAPIEVRFEERGYPEVSLDDLLRTGGNPN